MIIFLTVSGHQNTLHFFIEKYATTLNARVKSYDWLFATPKLPVATYIFTDMERMTPYELAAACQVYNYLDGAGLRLLNNPAKVRTRFSLLHQLHQAGINPFRAYRAELLPQPENWPVFVRAEANHERPVSDLLNNQQELDAHLSELEAKGTSLRDLLVIEFCAEKEEYGTYIKHQVFNVDGKRLTQTSVRDNSWYVKEGTFPLGIDAELIRNNERMDNNAGADEMAPIFDIARIDYGRVDFSYVDGKPVIYEVNTNPTLTVITEHRSKAVVEARQRSEKRLAEALAELDRHKSGTLPNCPDLPVEDTLVWPLQTKLLRP